MTSGTSAPTARTAPVKVGTLADAELETGRLFTDEFEPKNIKQACYELRASERYYRPPDPTVQIASEGSIVIPPGELVVIITMETLNLPSDILGRILTKGSLFSIGLSPVNTYADPGFRGQLGIVLQNRGTDYIQLPTGEAIAKIEFCRLAIGVRHPYSGQHGYGTRIWPIPVDMIMTSEQVKEYKRKHKIDLAKEVQSMCGPEFAGLVRRITRYERRLILTAVAYFSLALIAILTATPPQPGRILEHLISFSGGIAASLATALIIWTATKPLKG